MAKRPRRKPAPEPAELPLAIATEADLEAHVAALIAIEPYFGTIQALTGPLPMRQLDPGFHGLFWIISGQQISVAAGRAIFNRAEAALGTLTPENVAGVDDTVLKTAGLSGPKIRTLRAVSAALLSGELDLPGLLELEPEDAIAHLSAVKGIGRWTSEVYLLFALGHPDIFPAGDLALKEGARLAFDLAERPSEKELIARAEAWHPHRSAAARLIWAYYGAVKSGKQTTPV
ncbi:MULTISPECIES: DNA-3-methyladenine glycosylase [Rhodomicrobium]|uniref:DNA-3-methyladenine glycosylase family protein n=1 Tax=Rhodomicrobium TaxID=1068 RepID=UPI000B4BEB6C|nr:MULTISPECIES: DNA-3-methyladenine glycosylase [Rhodomicrobium]